MPAGCSTAQLFHFGQLIKTGRFQRFDPDFFKKRGIFSRPKPSPQDYNLANVKVPVALYYSDKDWLADFTDVQRLKAELPNVIKDYQITQGRFNHQDFLWGVDAPTVIYDKILNTMNQTNDSS